MAPKRSIAVITTSRADYGLLYWTLRAIQEHPDLQLQLIVGGTHLSPAHGLTRTFIEQDGFKPAAMVDFVPPIAQDDHLSTAMALSGATSGFARALHNLRPDIVLLLGDRYETLAAAAAAVTLLLPIAHVHGGDRTEGAMDESFRHAITKLSHLHLAATEDAARRIVQLGEQPDRVHVCGAPGVEMVTRCPRMDIQELSRSLKAPLRAGFLLVTYHPETLSSQSPEDQVQQLVSALQGIDRQLVITGCNADPGAERIIQRLQDLCHRRDGAFLFASVGQNIYVNLMRHAAAMVGNSSSGIIEAPSIPIPVVNIGDRQRGRLRAANVIDVPCNDCAIAAGIQTATSDSFRRGLLGLNSPYGDGRTSEQIVQVLAAVQLGPGLLQKTFHDLPAMEAVNR